MKYRYAACCLAIKDDFCLEESITELFHQGVSRVLILSPEAYWTDDCPQSPADLDQLHGVANRTGAMLVSRYRRAKVSQHIGLYTEALYRNYGVEYLTHDSAIDYVLTVDSDEFWKPGTLEHIDSLAEAGPLKINLPLIPVIGVPGLPVEGAKDSAVVATTPDVKFIWGRATAEVKTKTGTVPVIHFSATRKTLKEVIDKNRQSAHYSDPTYEFEKWITETLPAVHVGMKNVHMYVDPSVWPLVRAWTPEELRVLPKNLHPYLAKTV